MKVTVPFPFNTALPGTNVLTMARPDLQTGGAYLIMYRYEELPGRGWIMARYRVDNPGTLWPILDAYEDCDPGQPTLSEYRREKIPVTAGPGRTLAAWTYLYNGPVAGRRRILSGDYARLS